MMTGRLTQKELRAISNALALTLAGELDDSDDGVEADDYRSAQVKIASRINWKPGE